jgi:hypothetical protein
MTATRKPAHISARKMAGRRNSRIWHSRQRQPDPWYATPAGQCRSLDPSSAEFAEIAARYATEARQ